MRFPNLVWSIAQHRLAHYEAAAGAAMSPSRFSRCLNGRSTFSRDERTRLANNLGYGESWLFKEPHPPTSIHRVEVTA